LRASLTRAALIALTLVVVAVGSAAATTFNRHGDQVLANRLTLHMSDMPTGWRAVPPSTPSTSCKIFESITSLSTAKAETDFSESSGGAFSQVGVLPTLALSKRTYLNVLTNAAGCLLKLSGVDHPRVGELSVPRIGDQSKGWSLQGSVKTLHVHGELVVVRIRRALALYLFAGFGVGDSVAELRLVRQAASRA